ncbi:MAG: phosphatase PAP2 family protein [Candidatus Brocadiia bacterium]
MGIIDLIFIFSAQYLYAAIIVIGFFYFLRQSSATRKQMIILGVFVLPITYAVAKIAGHFYYNPRPFVQDNFIPLILHKPNNGFPSSHTLVCAAISALVYPFSRKLSMILWMMTALVGISRVYVGVHHFIDICGSAVISIAVTRLMYKLVTRLKPQS